MPTAKIKSLSNKRMNAIIRSGLNEFSQKSFKEASYNHIIQKAGLGKGTMYYYFASKEDLFLTLTRGSIKGFLPENSQKPLNAQTKSEFFSSLETLFEACFEFAKSEPKVFKLLWRHYLPYPAPLDHPDQEAQTQFSAYIDQLLLKAKQLNILTNPWPLSLQKSLIFSQLHTSLLWFENPQKIDPGPLAKAALVLEIISKTIQAHDEGDQKASPSV